MYAWIVITGGIFSFVAAMGIGANDVANAYATSVGSRALTMTQSVILASIFESSGAIFMGSRVTETIRKGISDYECFENDPGALMYGCMWVCFSVGLWLFLASKYEMPVSTTHSCVGGMIGMTMALKGPNCVIWYEPKETFPYIGGVSGIVLSWIVSPFFSAMISSLFFYVIRSFILRSKYSFDRTSFLFPIIVGGTITLNVFYIIYKGAKGLGLDETPLDMACIWSFGSGGVVGLMMIPLIPYLKNKIITNIETNAINEIELQTKYTNEVSLDDDNPIENKNIFQFIKNNLKVNLDDIIEKDDVVSDIHNNAEKFDPQTEEYFKYLQIFTAIFDSFSHGANDVANAIGPFAAIYMISKEKEVEEKSEMDDRTAYMILSLGGIGISIGLLCYGYKIIQVIGLKLCKITPSRGSLIELSSAIVIITGSRLEIPLSTTHCQIGATLGIATLEDPKNCSGMNSFIVCKTIAGWVLTLVVVGSTTALLTAQGSHSQEVGNYCE